MTVLQPRNLWSETGRWTKEMEDIMYKVKEGDQEIGLGPTHEEMLTDIIRHSVSSYHDLPQAIYQIQTKFRKELRPKSGLLRGKEFQMKDLYSFHVSEEDFKEYYLKVIQAYFKVFKRCGLAAILTEASGAGFTKEFTHEFQVLAEDGEDNIVYCPKGDFSQNKEVAMLKAGQKCPACKGILKENKSIEVGNIFPLKDKYSKAMKALFRDKDGKQKAILMGCYGIGVSRTMGAVVEVNHDEKGIIWPTEIAPFVVHLIQVENNKKIQTAAQKAYSDLEKAGVEVLYDDRDKSAGEKFAEADLIGLPIRLVVSQRTLSNNSLEIKKRREEKTRLVKQKDLLKHVK